MNLRQAAQRALHALEWNYNTDLDNIPACEQWAKMLKENIAALRAALAEPQRTWVRLTNEEIDKIYEAHHNQYGECETPNFGYERDIEDALKEKNT